MQGHRFFPSPSQGSSGERGREEGATGEGCRRQVRSPDPQVDMQQSPAASGPFSPSPSLEKEGRGFIYPVEMGLGRHELTPAQKSLYQHSRERNGETAHAAPPRPIKEHLKNLLANSLAPESQMGKGMLWAVLRGRRHRASLGRTENSRRGLSRV